MFFYEGVGCVNAHNKPTVVALLIIGNFCVGWIEALTQTMTSIVVDDQQEIGVAVGVASSIRSGFSAVATAIFTAVLTNRLGITVKAIVPQAVAEAGLPADSVAPYLEALSAGAADAISSIPGMTDHIMAVGTEAYKVASAQAYSTVYLCSLAFSGLGLVLSFFTPNVDDRMTNEVAAVIYKADSDLKRN